jgi:hypothetical protein
VGGVTGAVRRDQRAEDQQAQRHRMLGQPRLGNIARGRRFSNISRSATSSFGFNAAVNASPKNAAFTGSVDSLALATDAPTVAERRIPDRDEAPLSSA